MTTVPTYEGLPVIRPESFLSSSANDDTAALQQAIDTAANTGAIVQLSERIYTISSTLTLYSATVIQGSIPGYQNGNGSYFTGSMIKYTGSSGEAMRIVCESNQQDTQLKNNAFRFRLSYFTLVCGVSSNTAIGISFATNDSTTAPRQAVVEFPKFRNSGA